jgi:Chlorophyll A-B binding protein
MSDASYSSMPGDGEHTRPDSPPQARYELLLFPRLPFETMNDSTPRFGFVAFAETWNGRLAMLGFVIGLATEALTGQSILSQIGLG